MAGRQIFFRQRHDSATPSDFCYCYFAEAPAEHTADKRTCGQCRYTDGCHVTRAASLYGSETGITCLAS